MTNKNRCHGKLSSRCHGKSLADDDGMARSTVTIQIYFQSEMK